MLVSVIIPTYNERQNIIALIKQISNTLNKRSLEFEIIIVDDNSPDDTYHQIKNNYPHDRRIRPYNRKSDRGLATAIMLGITKARGSVIIGMDADFNHPPSLIPKLIRALDQADFIVASRFIKGGSMKEPIRYYLTYIFNLFLKNVLGFPVLDNLSGFYAVKRKLLLKLPLGDIYQGYGEYHLRLLKSIQNHHLKIVQIPVIYGQRKFGQSKSLLLILFFRYLKVAFHLTILR
jgi:dolichol-phosphate mannosyltransferase